MRHSEAPREEVYRGRYALPLAGAGLLLGAFVVYDTVSRADGWVVRVVVASVALAATLVYAVAFRPAILLDAHGVRLCNVLRDVDIPWARVEAVRARWSLVVETDDGRSYPSWAIASGRPTGAGRPEDRVPGLDRFGAPAAAGGPDRPVLTYAQSVKQSLVRRWEGWRASGRPDRGNQVEVRWAWPSILPVAVTAAVLVAALAS